MKRLTVRAEPSMTSIAITIAVIMMDRSFAIPTAVITESSENTMSRSRICRSTHRNTPRTAAAACSCGSASTFS